MVKALIIDDEQVAVSLLGMMIERHLPEITSLQSLTNPALALKLINEYKPDIVFLDIEMPRMDGFEMLHQLPVKNFHIIFTTAYDQYAIKAIKYAAFDYLLKPIDIDELKSSVSKIYNHRPVHTEKKLEVLEQNMKSRNAFNKIAVSTLDGLLFFNITDIVHLEASSNYTIIYFNNQPKLVASKTLKDFEELLPVDIFFRPHHSHIINLNYIKRYLKGDGGQIEMQNGNYVDVARRKKDEFLKTIGLSEHLL
jgi:two-component system LytT family response regulator